MKTIFIFDDSRPTDALHRIVALGEDGQRLAAVMFDGWMLPHCRYAMAALHTSDVNHDNVDAVRKTRTTTVEKFDAVYGSGGWVFAPRRFGRNAKGRRVMVTEARENELLDKAVDLLEAAGVPTMPRAEACAFLTGVMTTAFMLLRTVADDEYLRGWLAGASGDLYMPPAVSIRKPS